MTGTSGKSGIWVAVRLTKEVLLACKNERYVLQGANIAVSIPYVLPLAQPRGVATNMQNIARLQLGKADELSRSCPIQSGVKVQHVKISSCLPLPPVSVCVCANPESETLNPKQPLNIPNPSTIPKSKLCEAKRKAPSAALSSWPWLPSGIFLTLQAPEKM